MSYKLEWIFQYRRLLSKATELGMSLTADEQRRLQRLQGQLPGAVPECDEADGETFLPEPLRAQFVWGARFHNGQVCNASAEGMALTVEHAPEVGQLLQLHVWDPAQSVDYTFPSRVVSVESRGEGSVLRVAFEGAPGSVCVGVGSEAVTARAMMAGSGTFRSTWR